MGNWLSLHPGVINNINTSVSSFSILNTCRMSSLFLPLPCLPQSRMWISPIQGTMRPITSVLQLSSAAASSTWSHMKVYPDLFTPRRWLPNSWQTQKMPPLLPCCWYSFDYSLCCSPQVPRKHASPRPPLFIRGPITQFLKSRMAIT